MKICSVVFNYPGYLDYKRLAHVLAYSAAKNCPGAAFSLVELPAPKVTSSHRCFTSNTVKLREWLRIMRETDDDVIFMDADMVILRDLAPAFASQFDVGYTVHARTTGRLPFNSGVVFVKNTPAARDFIAAWRDVNERMYSSTLLHAPYRQKYAGMNQASFGYLLEHRELWPGTILKTFPCKEWNACMEDWPTVDPAVTRVIHVKSGLRRMIISGAHIEACGRYVKSVRIWREVERQSKEPRVAARIAAIAQKRTEEVEPLRAAPAAFAEPPVARKETVAFLAKVLRRLMRPSFGLCHGSGKGQEQEWFAHYLGCDVVGTEISEEARGLPKTVIWDFSKRNPEWRRCVDFIYSNAFDLVYDKQATLVAWTDAMKPGGVMIIESGNGVAEFTEAVPEWTGGAWGVTKSFGIDDAWFALLQRTKSARVEVE